MSRYFWSASTNCPPVPRVKNSVLPRYARHSMALGTRLRSAAISNIEYKVSENISPTKEENKENTHYQIGKSISF